MIVKIVIKGERAVISGPPGSQVSPFEESAARLRCRFVEGGDAIGFFEADTRRMGESTKPDDPSIKPATIDVFEIKNRVYPEKVW